MSVTVAPLNVLVWHVHGSYMDSLVAGRHHYLLPVRAGSDQGGRRPAWPLAARNVTPADARALPIDVAIVQRPDELAWLPDWLGERRVPVVVLEHNAPQGRINEMRHPFADRDDVIVVHVTHFNALMWDCGATRTRVIEHGIPDLGYRYTGDVPHLVAVINEAQRRARVTGTDLLPHFERVAPIDLYGIGANDVPRSRLHDEMARRRAYIHPNRWTSLGLSLLEAMMLGMPVVALATTEATRAVRPGTGICTNDLDEAKAALEWLMTDRVAAAAMGRAAREHVLANYGLGTFHARWDAVLAEAVR